MDKFIRVFLPVGMGILVLCGLASCDKNGHDDKAEPARTAARQAPPKDVVPAKASAVIGHGLRQRVMASQVFPAELTAALREEFATVLEAYGGDAEQAVKAWLESYLNGVESGKVEAMAYALLRAIRIQAFEAGGRYIENNFKSAQSRRQALANWFDQGARMKRQEVAALFQAIKDPADSEFYARSIAGAARIDRDRSFSDALGWLKNQVGDEYYGDAVNEFLNGGRVVPRTPADRKVLEDLLANAKGLSEETRASAAKAWASSAAPGDLMSDAEFLQKHGINADGVWTKIISQCNAKDMDSFAQLRDMLPENSPQARTAIATAVVSNLGVTAESLAFLTSGRDYSASEVNPYVASILKSESYGEMAGLVGVMENQTVRDDMIWQVIEWGILGGKSPVDLEPFTTLVNDPARLNVMLRQAEVNRKMNKAPGQP